MLNLLIAIMSDTFDRVMNNIVHQDAVEMNQLILESEVLMFWNRHKGT